MPHTPLLRRERTIAPTQVNSSEILQASMITDMAITTTVVAQTGVRRTHGAASVAVAEVESPSQEEAEVASNSKLSSTVKRWSLSARKKKPSKLKSKRKMPSSLFLRQALLLSATSVCDPLVSLHVTSVRPFATHASS